MALFIRKPDDWDLLFIRRTESKNDRHSGQVAFPGGARESTDESLRVTALRETFEETGIRQENVRVLGELMPYQTISNFRVLPFIGILDWPVELRPAADEVARIFTIPLSWLADHSNFEIRPRTAVDQQNSGRTHPVIYYEKYDNELLWGATARMTVNLTRAISEGTIDLPNDR